MAAGKPILYVSHDEDDYGWQFLEGADQELEDLTIIGLAHILEIDPEMEKLAQLEPGYHATRVTQRSAWVVEKTPAEPENEGEI
ncbi:MAG: hypothetical protein V4739_16700 [Pseudomonadota bacterium]